MITLLVVVVVVVLIQIWVVAVGMFTYPDLLQLVCAVLLPSTVQYSTNVQLYRHCQGSLGGIYQMKKWKEARHSQKIIAQNYADSKTHTPIIQYINITQLYTRDCTEIDRQRQIHQRGSCSSSTGPPTQYVSIYSHHSRSWCSFLSAQTQYTRGNGEL